MHELRRKTVQHFNIPGHAHELTFSCYQRLPLLFRDRTRQWLIQAIENARRARHFSVLAFVIMPEHVHIIVYPHDAASEISWFLKSMKQPVAKRASQWLKDNDPAWHKRLCTSRSDGMSEFHFWQQGGGYDRNIENNKTLLQMITYIHNNPVRRGLIEKAVDWKWSSASWYEKGEGILKIDPFPF